MRGINTYNKFRRDLASCGVKGGANQGVNHAKELTSYEVKEGANHVEELASCEAKEEANQGVNHAEGILHVVPCSN